MPDPGNGARLQRQTGVRVTMFVAITTKRGGVSRTFIMIIVAIVIVVLARAERCANVLFDRPLLR